MPNLDTIDTIDMHYGSPVGGRVLIQCTQTRTSYVFEVRGVAMQTFKLRDEWTSLETERALVAAVARNPALYWELLDSLPAGVFAFDETGEAWALLVEAIEAERKPAAPEWTPASDPQAAALRLADLLQRRLLAEAMETVAGNLNSERSAAEVLTEAEEAIARAQAAIRATQAGKLTWAAELVGDAGDARRARQRERPAAVWACQPASNVSTTSYGKWGISVGGWPG